MKAPAPDRPARIERGDFQTPASLAAEVCGVLAQRGLEPRSILEPTCGRGSFLAAALRFFPRASTVVGVDIDGSHLSAARKAL